MRPTQLSGAVEARRVTAETAMAATPERGVGIDESEGREAVPGDRRRICLLALSRIVDDPRVRRQGDLFHAHGWEVSAAGMPGGSSLPPAWRILGRAIGAADLAADRRGGLPRPAAGSCDPAGNGSRDGVVRAALSARRPVPWRRVLRSRKLAAAISQYRRIRRALKYRARMIQARFQVDIAEQILWNDLAISHHLRSIYEAAAGANADIWLANDWTLLPVAARLARENGGLCVYDTHEFATEEYAERPSWQRWTRPLVLAIERKYIREVAAVSTASAGIAKALDRLYTLPRPTLVVRNTPQYESSRFRPTGSRVRVLYHGIVVPGRGLELAIDSVVEWQPEFELTIRGPENPELTPALRRRIAALGLEHRVHLAPPVPMTALVREAAAFDIGFFVWPGHSQHNEFALPNKIFEYMMAGLCLCTPHLPEIAAIVEQYQVGITIPQLDAGVIARAINGLDRHRIDACKQNALSAARELCWERESEPFLRSCDALLLQRADLPG
jgi:glycosyltransferase involved in cell wall biosynthesis